MKSQVHNQGELKELKVSIEKDLVNVVEEMSKNSGLTIDDIVCIALKRYKTTHSDLIGTNPEMD